MFIPASASFEIGITIPARAIEQLRLE